MRIFTDPAEFQRQCLAWRKDGQSIALVPTMGYYHQGHESLMDFGRAHADRLVVSLFVNPAQFGPEEDLAAYPRDLARDSEIAASHGTDALFCPSPETMYAANHASWVELPSMSSVLCGKSRPGHFRGVCTVVLKLLLLSQADIAVFGEKDWQQQAILRRMVSDLNVPVRIVSRPIAREEDGLAMSSRNVYLSAEERAQAPAIRKGLLLARKLWLNGQRDAETLYRAIRDYWRQALPGGQLDYLQLVHPETLETLTEVGPEALLACAVRLGKARLIDNILLNEEMEA